MSRRVREVSKSNKRVRVSGQSLLRQGIIVDMDKEKKAFTLDVSRKVVRLSIRFMKSEISQVTKMDKATM